MFVVIMILLANPSYSEDLKWQFPKLEDVKKDLEEAQALKRAHKQKVADFNKKLQKKIISAEELEKLKLEKVDLADESRALYKLLSNAKSALRKAADLKKELYIERNKTPFILEAENQGDKMSTISPDFFKGGWKVSQSLYVHTPSHASDVYFENNDNSNYYFFIADKQTLASVKDTYKDFSFKDGSTFHCTTLAHEQIQNQLFSVYAKAAYKKLKHKIPSELKEGSKEWKAASDELRSAIRRKGQGLWKKYPHKVISFVKTENNTKQINSCGQYLYVGRVNADPNYDFYLGASNGLSVDVINNNKFIVYQLWDKYLYPGRYAIFERVE